jgi:hypothetical protein
VFQSGGGGGKRFLAELSADILAVGKDGIGEDAALLGIFEDMTMRLEVCAD